MNDLIMRRFMVERGESVIPYDFLCKSNVFRANGEKYEDLINSHLLQVLVSGFPSRAGKQSVSSLPELIVGKQAVDSDIPSLAKKALGDEIHGNHAHSRVQMELMKETWVLGCEVPVWDDETHGFIDILGVKDDKVLILDFKPYAQREKKGASQVTRYKHLLHKMLGIPLSDIRLGYFDHILYYNVF